MIDPAKSAFKRPPRHPRCAGKGAAAPRPRRPRNRGVGAGPLAIVYHRRKREAGLITASTWSPFLKKTIAMRAWERPYGVGVVDDLWTEIYALHELAYSKMMKRGEDRAAAVPQAAAAHRDAAGRHLTARRWVTLSAATTMMASTGGRSWPRPASRGRAAPAMRRRCTSTSRGRWRRRCSKIYRICSRLDDEDPLDALRAYRIGARWIEVVERRRAQAGRGSSESSTIAPGRSRGGCRAPTGRSSAPSPFFSMRVSAPGTPAAVTSRWVTSP